MTIQGTIGTGDFGGTVGSPDTIPAFERPTNWRQGILMRFPNGHAPLVALTSVMKKKVTDDPQFHWWERELSNRRLQLGTTIDDTITTLVLVADPFGFGAGNQVKAGDVIRSEETGELMKIVTASGTAATVVRDYAGSTGTAINVATENPNFVIIGSVYEEGADTPNSVRYRPVKQFNYTQIFRDSLKATRTAMHTRLRTVDEVRDAKQQALLYHSIGMEYGFFFGLKNEEVGAADSQPERMTGGVLQFIEDEGNVKDFSAAPVGVPFNELEDVMLEAFRFGAQEKMCFLGNRAMLTIQRMVRGAASMEITPAVKEYGMDVRRLFTPFGTLVLKTHPLFNQISSDVAGGFWTMDTWMVILDLGNITYRPLRNSDTQYLPDRQSNGVDGLTSEYLTEAGLEVNHAKTHYLIKGLHEAAEETFPIDNTQA